MKRSIPYILWIIGWVVSVQVQAQRYSEKLEVQDFNEDGAMDSLFYWFEGGSSFGGTYAQVVNGANGETYGLNSDGCFCAIRSVYYFPPGLCSPGFRPFLRALQNKVFPAFQEQPDPSLHWILKSIGSESEGNKESVFDQFLDPQVSWEKGRPWVPKNYSLKFSFDSLRRLSDDPQQVWASNLVPFEGCLSYYSGVHGGVYDSSSTFHPVDSNAHYTIYRTRHAVVAQWGDRYKWLFITDSKLTGAPDKLRWSSIDQVQLKGDWLLIHQSLAPDDRFHLYLVHIESGRCARLRYYPSTSRNYDNDPDQAVVWKGENLQLQVDGELITLSWADLQQELLEFK